MHIHMYSPGPSTDSGHVAHATGIGKHIQIKKKEREKGQSEFKMI